jgi:hypothetical protein
VTRSEAGTGRRTEDAYVQWIRRFILHHRKRHPREMGRREITEFLTTLAVRDRTSTATSWLGTSPHGTR